MSKTAPDHTSAGWPYVTVDHYVDALPLYTVELAEKLENADADVAAAINAATAAQAAKTAAENARDAAQAAVNSLPPSYAAQTSLTFNASTSVSKNITWPAGRFTAAPTVQLTTHAYLVGGRVENITAAGCRIVLFYTSALSVTVEVSVYAVKAH